jgi:hypothetical protein
MLWLLVVDKQCKENQIFSMINFIGTLSLFFILNPTFVHHPLIVLLSGQNINLYLLYDTKILTKNEKNKQITMKAHTIFIHIC